jgi:hypothetical protein
MRDAIKLVFMLKLSIIDFNTVITPSKEAQPWWLFLPKICDLMYAKISQ